MAASRAQAGPAALSTPVTPPMDGNSLRLRATEEEEAYRKAPDMAVEEQKGDVTIIPNPLNLWKDNSTDIPLLSAPTQGLLAILATWPQSERTFSCAGVILTKMPNRLIPTVETCVLKHSWGLIDEGRTSNAASMS